MSILARSLALAFGGAAVALVPSALAQNADPAARTTARFLSTLEANDNFDLRADSPGIALIWTNTIGASFRSFTPVDRLTLDVQGTYRATDAPGDNDRSAFDDPRLTLDFAREVDDSSLDFNLALRRIEVGFYDPLDDIDEDGSFEDTASDGVRESISARAGISLNEAGPVSFSATARLREEQYSEDEPDDNLDDSRRIGVDAEVGIELTPILRTFVGAGYNYRETDNDDEDESRTLRLDTGLTARLNQRLTATFRIGISQVEETSDGETTDESAVVGSLGFNADLPNGQLRGSIARRLNESGTRNDLTFGRTVDLRSGSFSADLGLTNSDETAPEPIGTLAYAYSLPRGSLFARAQRSASIDEDLRDVLNTSVEIGGSRLLTRLSSINVSLRAARQVFEDDDADDNERLTLVTSYNRALTRDWGVNVGYRHRIEDDEGQQRATSNSVFLSVRRDFSSSR